MTNLNELYAIYQKIKHNAALNINIHYLGIVFYTVCNKMGE